MRAVVDSVRRLKHSCVFSIFLFFPMFSLLLFFLFSFFLFFVVRADVKTGKNRGEVPVVKMTIFFCENLICGPRWSGGEGGGYEWPT